MGYYIKTWVKWTLGGIGLVLMLFVLAVAFNFANVATMFVTAPARIAVQTMRTDNIVGNYEWFRQQVQDIRTAKQRYENNKETYDAYVASLGPDRTAWTSSDRQEANRLQSIVLGSKNFYVDLVNDYNARASMDNRSMFKDGLDWTLLGSDSTGPLPSHIEAEL